MTGGAITVREVVPEHLTSVLGALSDGGAQIDIGPDCIRLKSRDRPRPLRITTAPYPGLPTDLQSQFMAWMCLAEGRSTIRDTIFPQRFQHAIELRRLGAQIRRRGSTALVTGVPCLNGAVVNASDLRASAVLVLAGMAAEGTTLVRRIHHLERG